MKIFQYVQKLYGVLGIHRPNLNQNNTWNRRKVLTYFMLVQFTGTSIIFFLFQAKTFKEYADSFYISATASLKVCTYTVSLWKMPKVFKLIDNFQNFIQKRLESPESKAYYEKINEKIEKAFKITQFAFIKISLPAIMLPNCILTYYFVATKHDVFRLSFPVWMPFDWKTPICYFIVFVVQFVSFYFLLYCCTCIISFLIGSCWILISFTEDMKTQLGSLKQTNGHLENQKILRKFIESHAKAKEFVYDFIDYFAIVITAYYVWSICTISSTLLVVQMEIAHEAGHWIEMVQPSILMCWSFVQILMFCDLGENVTTGFSTLGDSIYFCDWYNFPLEIQRTLPTLLMVAEKSVELRGFGNIPCTRKAFRKALKAGFSYFMVLRTIE